MASEWTDLPDLPPELEGAISDLGHFRAEYRAGWSLLLSMLLGIFLLVTGSGVTLLFVVLLLDEHFNAAFAKLFILAIGFAVGGGFMCFRSLRAWGARVLVFERCIVYLKGNKLRVFGWDEITSFHQKSPTGFWEKMTQSSYWMTLRRKDGAVLTIDAYVHQAKHLGSHVEKELSRRQAAEPVAESEEGK